MDRISAAEKFMTDYREILSTMQPKEICEEISFLIAVKDSVRDKYDDYQSVVSYIIDTMYEYCNDEVLARVIGGSLEPCEANLV